MKRNKRTTGNGTERMNSLELRSSLLYYSIKLPFLFIIIFTPCSELNYLHSVSKEELCVYFNRHSCSAITFRLVDRQKPNDRVFIIWRPIDRGPPQSLQTGFFRGLSSDLNIPPSV